MNKPLDNFFREKLEHAHKPAPVAAWDRIEAGLEGRQRKGLWLKIAASVLIVAAGSFVLWPGQQNTDTQRVAEAKTSTVHGPQSTVSATEENTSRSTSKQQAQEPAPAMAMNASPTVNRLAKKQQSKKPVNSITPVNIDKASRSALDQPPVAYEAHEARPVITEPASVYESVTPVQPAPASANVVLAETDAEETDEAVTLVYSASEIDEKYLDKEALAKATSSQKKSSTFRKLLEKAYDLKNNQDPMGGLRQKKNEILALSFKSEKRSQNK
jgi:hypothetical protein